MGQLSGNVALPFSCLVVASPVHDDGSRTGTWRAPDRSPDKAILSAYTTYSSRATSLYTAPLIGRYRESRPSKLG